MNKCFRISLGVRIFLCASCVALLLTMPGPGAAGPSPSLPGVIGPKAELIPWQKLFGDEDWYKKGPPQEMIIRGLLEAVPDPEAPSIIMRTYYYRLRQWNIYTAGKRIPLLDRYVGQEVEILGKEVKLALEGQELLEFWPSAIRRALPHPKWPKLPPKPPATAPDQPTEPVPPTKPGAKQSKSPAKKPSEASWQKLFADEDWYQQAEGEEQIFRGRLEALPPGPEIDILMRTSFYRLGDRNIYTGARKLEVLDRLVGQEVEILGKPVDMALEGQQLKEIWPAAIRPAANPTPPPKLPPIRPKGKK
ncbi:MAG: hypothetical protein NZ602_06900 [Thermoguttaceae bacterium]|nr:hypothetical protein [Thermoguttaceae bacterium]MDW8038510.1 hypothetical protein [Thermoguttaceae bacterium]